MAAHCTTTHFTHQSRFAPDRCSGNAVVHSSQRIEGWRARQRGIAVRLRTPKLIYSHRYCGAAPGDEVASRHLASRVVFAADLKEAVGEARGAAEREAAGDGTDGVRLYR